MCGEYRRAENEMETKLTEHYIEFRDGLFDADMISVPHAHHAYYDDAGKLLRTCAICHGDLVDDVHFVERRRGKRDAYKDAEDEIGKWGELNFGCGRAVLQRLSGGEMKEWCCREFLNTNREHGQYCPNNPKRIAIAESLCERAKSEAPAEAAKAYASRTWCEHKAMLETGDCMANGNPNPCNVCRMAGLVNCECGRVSESPSPTPTEPEWSHDDYQKIISNQAAELSRLSAEKDAVEKELAESYREAREDRVKLIAERNAAEQQVDALQKEIQLITAPIEAGGGYAAKLKAEVDALRTALQALPEIALNWANNLANEWRDSQKDVWIYGDNAYQHTDKTIHAEDCSKKYAAECLSNVWKIQKDKVVELLSGEKA